MNAGIGSLALLVFALGVEDARKTLLATAPGTELRVILDTGEVVEGRLAEANDTSFALWVEIDYQSRSQIDHHVSARKRRLTYEEVGSVTRPGGEPLDELSRALQAGRRVKVTSPSGDVVQGKVTRFDGERLEVDDHTWRLDDGGLWTIEARVPDSLVDGTLIGTGVGAGLSLLVIASCGTSCPDSLAPMLPVIGIGAGLGVLIDALLVDTKVFRAGGGKGGGLVIRPVVGPGRAGVLATLGF